MTPTPRRKDFTADELAPILAAVAAAMIDHAGGEVSVVIEALEVVRTYLVEGRAPHDATVRSDLTDRECASHVGGLVGGLLTLADATAVRRALRWWAKRPLAEYATLKREVVKRAEMKRARRELN